MMICLDLNKPAALRTSQVPHVLDPEFPSATRSCGQAGGVRRDVFLGFIGVINSSGNEMLPRALT